MLPLDPAHHHRPDLEDPTLGKRKASQITVDPEAVPPANQKRKKRRKVGSDRSISVAVTPTVTAEPFELEEWRKLPGEMARNVSSTSATTDANQVTVSPTQKKRKKKRAKSGQSDSTSVDPAEQRVEESTEVVSAPEPPPAEASKTKKRRKTVVLDLSTVIPLSAATQVYPGPSVRRFINLWNTFRLGPFAFHDRECYQKTLSQEKGQNPGRTFGANLHCFPRPSSNRCRRACRVQCDHETETARQ